MTQNSQLGTHLNADELSVFVDGKASSHERKRILAHLGDCPECRAIVFLMQSETAAVVSSTVSEKKHPWRHWIMPVGLAGAALACSLALAAYFAAHRGEQITQRNEPVLPPTRSQAAVPALNNTGTPPNRQLRPNQLTAGPPTLGAQKNKAPGAQEMPRKTLNSSQLAGIAANRNLVNSQLQAGALLQDRKTASSNASTALAKDATPTPQPGLAQAPLANKEQENLRAFTTPPNLPRLRIEHDRGSEIDSSQVTGRVTDQTGAVIAGAEISLHDTEGKSTMQTKSGRDGTFELASVPPGHYELLVTAPGFETGQQTMDLRSRDMAMLDSVLKVGASSETVEVQSVAPLLNTESASVSTDQVVAELPSKLSSKSTVRLGRRILSLDSAGSLFMSRNGGRSWKKVKPQWTDAIAQIESIGATDDQAISMRKKKSADTSKDHGTFRLTTDKGSVWTSSDGIHWRAQ